MVHLLAAVLSVGLTIEARVSHQAVLVGEAIQVHAIWRASAPAEVFVDDGSTGLGALQLWVDDGSGPRHYREGRGGYADMTRTRTPLAPGDTLRVSLWLRRGRLDGGAEDFLFARPGRYRIRLVYQDVERGVHAETEVLTIQVAAPTGADDAAVLAAMHAQPELTDSANALAVLVRERPASRYMPYLRLRWYALRESLLARRVDPDTDQSLSGLDRTSLGAFKRQVLNAAARDLLAEPSWGPFEPESLALAVHYADVSNDAASAARGRAALFGRFPASEAAIELRRRDAEAAR